MLMGQVMQAKIGRKFAIYLPKAIVNQLDLKEGGKVLLTVADKTVVMHSVEDPIKLGLSGKKFASITPEKAERVSLEQQRSAIKSAR
jgi:AbrB family looped-hinge helix DNA binding protein